MKRSKPTRAWSDAIAKAQQEGMERGCRVCSSRNNLQTAHTYHRRHDKNNGYYVDPLDVICLCEVCHLAYDSRRLDILPYLSVGEQSALVEAAGGLVNAYRRATGERLA